LRSPSPTVFREPYGRERLLQTPKDDALISLSIDYGVFINGRRTTLYTPPKEHGHTHGLSGNLVILLCFQKGILNSKLI